jgi:acyl-CoA synthetase (AMP-forming)/AMP-acid ligase II
MQLLPSLSIVNTFAESGLAAHVTAEECMSFPINGFNPATLVELLRYRAAHQPEQVAYTFLADGETESGNLTYGKLDHQARAIATHLQALGPMGYRALTVYPYTAGLEFIVAFFGCLYAGVIAVTANPPRNKQGIADLQARSVSAQATVGLTTQALLEQIKPQLILNPELAAQFKQLQWLATDTISPTNLGDWQEPDLNSDTLAFLQHTSGSTGTPKGVMVTHGNILHNSVVIHQGFGHHPESRGLMWLPLFHDMGLIGGVIQPLYAGCSVVLMSPVSLIQKPVNWLKAIAHYRTTTSGGANFAYDLLCQKVTPAQREELDLSCWEVAFTGAEPIRTETLDHFVETFGPCGFRREAFYPCYGMAEASLMISGGLKTAAPVVRYVDGPALTRNQVVSVAATADQARAIVGCGRAWLGDKIVIVDPDTLMLCAPDQVGEIWVAGAGIGKGYWQQPDETAQTFAAYLADTGEGPFLRTGDLGFLQEGELFITGRLKDLLILWGRNHYPQHLEATVETAHPALRSHHGAAFAVDVQGEERLVIVHEVDRHYLRQLDVEAVVTAMYQAVAEEHLAELYAVQLLKTGTIPKTSSGKIQRRACKARFLEGSLTAVGEWRLPTEHSTISDLVQQLPDP